MTPTPDSPRRVLLTGARGFLGTAVRARFASAYKDLEVYPATSTEFDLTTKDGVDRAYSWSRPHVVVHLACPYGGGGIGYANAHPASLALGMVTMDALMIEAAHRYGVRTFLGVGSVCAYPQQVTYPTGEDQLWAGYPEPINAPYGLAKRMQLTLLQAARKEWGLNGIHLILANLYGPGDHFGTGLVGHIIPSTIVKMEAARKARVSFIIAWGDGTPTREFCYIEDAARAIAQAVEYEGRDFLHPGEPVNVVSGEEVSIKLVVDAIASLMGFRGEIRWDPSKPGGQPRRWFSNARSRTELNWSPRVPFAVGLAKTVQWYLERQVAVERAGEDR